MGMGNEACIFLVMDKHQEVQGVQNLIREDYSTCEKPFQLWMSLDLDSLNSLQLVPAFTASKNLVSSATLSSYSLINFYVVYVYPELHTSQYGFLLGTSLGHIQYTWKESVCFFVKGSSASKTSWSTWSHLIDITFHQTLGNPSPKTFKESKQPWYHRIGPCMNKYCLKRQKTKQT